jgi:hypothetical protein
MTETELADELIDKLDAVVAGYPRHIAEVGATVILEALLSLNAPSAEAACAAVRSWSEDMQRRIRAEWTLRKGGRPLLGTH